MRLTSKFWVDVLLRRVFAEGCNASVVNRGAEEAGTIFVILNQLDGRFSLFGPAPQMILAEADHSDRVFVKLLSQLPEVEVLEKLAREKKFDSDLWIVEIEDRQGRPFLEYVDEEAW